ncbi:MAG: arsenic resistance protein [Streptosporangiaceae bacterium]
MIPTDRVSATGSATGHAGVVGTLFTLDRLLPFWIFAAMLLGLGTARVIPGLGPAVNAIQVEGISLPIAAGLLIMMYPVLAKVRYDRLDTVTRDRRLLILSLALNWVFGPAVLVVVNSVFQVIAFGMLGWFYLEVLPGWLDLVRTGLTVSRWAIARSVLIFLGIPLLAGYLSRRLGERAKGQDWYETRFLPKISPVALYGLLFTIVILFALQGGQITSHPLVLARIALPLLAYFAIMWTGSFALGKVIGLSYERTTTLAFTAAGNNFELAIAVAIATFGATSGQALAGVVGPLIEVPVLIGLVYAALATRRWFTPTPTPVPAALNAEAVNGPTTPWSTARS